MEIISRSAGETRKIGRGLARCLKEGDILCLFGNLGSGKTVLAKGVAVGLGIKQDDIISPTFVLLRQYSGKIALNHFDLYRLEGVGEITSLGYEEFFYGKAITIIEWPDRLGCLLPKDYLKLELFFRPGNKRLIKFSAIGARYRGLMEKIRENIGD